MSAFSALRRAAPEILHGADYAVEQQGGAAVRHHLVDAVRRIAIARAVGAQQAEVAIAILDEFGRA
jgi:hypothetical protein